MKRKQYCYDYPRPAITTDCIVFGKNNIGDFMVLLIERGNDPFKGKWAFPGGFLDMGETVLECAKRELMEETGLSGIDLTQIYIASRVDRDPRGRIISVIYTTEINISEYELVAGDDAFKAKWFMINDKPHLAFDHEEILDIVLSKTENFNK